MFRCVSMTTYSLIYPLITSKVTVFCHDNNNLILSKLTYLSILRSCPPRTFIPALCRIFLDESAPDNVLEVTARAVTYYLDVSAECTRRIVAVEGTIRAICNRLEVVDVTSRTSKDLAEQCVKVSTHLSSWIHRYLPLSILLLLSKTVINLSYAHLLLCTGVGIDLHSRSWSSIRGWWLKCRSFLHQRQWFSCSQRHTSFSHGRCFQAL